MGSDPGGVFLILFFMGLAVYRQHQRKKWIEQHPQQYQAQLNFWARILGR